MAKAEDFLSKGEKVVLKWKDFVVTDKRLIKKGDGFIYLDQLSGVRTKWTNKPKYLKYGIILFAVGAIPTILDLLGVSNFLMDWFQIDISSLFGLIGPASMLLGTVIAFFSVVGVKMTDFCGPGIKFSVFGEPGDFIKKLNEMRSNLVR